jgi:AraC-like DNA-binding protein
MEKSESGKVAQKVTKAFLLFLDAQFIDVRAGDSIYHFAGSDFADSVHLSRVELDHYLLLVTNQTALQHSDSRLLQSSKTILLSGVETVSSIAARFGMNHSEFTRFFKLFVGVSPEKFREQSRM